MYRHHGSVNKILGGQRSRPDGVVLASLRTASMIRRHAVVDSVSRREDSS